MAKQIILYFDQKTFDKIQNTLLPREKRSLTGQLAYLLLQDRGEKQLLHIKELWKSKSTHERAPRVPRAVKIMEDEYWKGSEQAVKARMPLRDFCIALIEDWAKEPASVVEEPVKLKAMGAKK
ncbi:MAG: hypothetical protein WAV20_24840 [Blastocatellia bacterium]